MKIMLYLCFILLWVFMVFVVPQHFAYCNEELPACDQNENAPILCTPVQCRTKHVYLYRGFELVKVNMTDLDIKGYYVPY